MLIQKNESASCDSINLEAHRSHRQGVEKKVALSTLLQLTEIPFEGKIMPS